MELLGKIYYWLLWLAGAALTDEELEELKGKGDRITYWFRRSKKRLGNLWWVAVVAFLILNAVILYDNIKNKRWAKVGVGCAVYVLVSVLTPHILGMF